MGTFESPDNITNLNHTSSLIASDEKRSKLNEIVYDVKVYHYLDRSMGHPVHGYQKCGPHIKCEWHHSRLIRNLRHFYDQNIPHLEVPSSINNWTGTITVGMYNIHNLIHDGHSKPLLCQLPTNLTMAD